MTTTLANLLLGVDMEGGENFCDSVYNFLKNQGKDINLITNSGFGVWSQSDTNKGIATMAFDSGSVEPVVGELLTDDVSAAVGKVITVTVTGGSWAGTNASGNIELGACAGRFNDNSTVTGSVGGANILTVNEPDAAVGVDLVRNGEFEAGVGGWTAVSCALASVGGGQVGNCLQLTRTGAAAQNCNQTLTVTTGKLYKFTIYVKSGTSGNEAFRLHFDNQDLIKGTSSAVWVKYTATYEYTGASGLLHLVKDTATAGTMFFDECSVYEITPCVTGLGAGEQASLDGWIQDETLSVYRQHNDGGTLTKDGSFYSLKMVPGAAGDYLYWPTTGFRTNEEWLQQFAGRPVTIGVWVKTSTADHFRIGIFDGAYTYSSYHTGGGDWEWIELTDTISATPTYAQVTFFGDAAPNVDGTTIIYMSQPILVFGWSLGEGMYQPRLQEIIWLEKNIPSNTYDNTANWGDVAAVAINIEADSDAMLPKGAKLIAVHSSINDSGSGGGLDVHLKLRKDATSDYFYCNSVAGKTNDVHAHKSGVQPCDVNGDVDIDIDATGGDTFDIEQFEYHGVQVT